MKDEYDEFENLQEGELQSWREETADKALISVVKTVAEIQRAEDLQAYARHPKINPKYINVPGGYKTEVTFGLHAGFTIEGSIGTEMKVDPLYLSPDMMIAQRVEGLNEHYGTKILMTGDLMDLLSKEGQELVRKIDQVYIRES